MRRRLRAADESLSGSTPTSHSAFIEAFRVLRSNVEVALADIEHPRVVVTSPHPSEGKSLVSTNLAAALAAAGRRVVLVDLDLRHPGRSHLSGAHSEFGVSDVLLGSRSLEESLQYIELPSFLRSRAATGLYFLGTGPEVINPTELLGGGRTARMLENLASQADIVLIDSPPVLPVADTLIIGRVTSGALLVAEARRTAVPAIEKAKELLIRNQTRLFGTVLNKFKAKYAVPGTSGDGYGYGLVFGDGLPDDRADGWGSANSVQPANAARPEPSRPMHLWEQSRDGRDPRGL